MPGMKITRKEIKRDELVEGLSGLAESVRLHSRSVAIAAGAVVLLAAAVAGGFWYSRSRAAEARLKLAAVYRVMATPAADEGAPGAAYATRRQKFEAVIRLADVVIADHPSSSGAKWATYYKAVGQKEVGDLAGALQTLGQIASDPDQFLSSSARFQQAQVHEAQGDAAGALEIYAGLVTSSPAQFPIEMAMMGQARLLEGQGKIDEAREIYRRVTEEYPDSPYSREASQRLSPASS